MLVVFMSVVVLSSVRVVVIPVVEAVNLPKLYPAINTIMMAIAVVALTNIVFDWSFYNLWERDYGFYLARHS